MNRTPVTSSNVSSIGYDVSTMTLEVEYRTGSIYQYFDVPQGVYQELMGAASVGTYLNQNVKNNYRYGRI